VKDFARTSLGLGVVLLLLARFFHVEQKRRVDRATLSSIPFRVGSEREEVGHHFLSAPVDRERKMWARLFEVVERQFE